MRRALLAIALVATAVTTACSNPTAPAAEPDVHTAGRKDSSVFQTTVDCGVFSGSATC
ncbi:MAG TPA: hypothetical protein VFY16_09115 [Gemmatimonadaceae bacterium]|nr:hypothetical protein [Gemmatimonadaceae bacterium]